MQFHGDIFVDFFRLDDDEHQLNIGTVGNPTYEQAIIQSTQSNINYQCADLPEAQYIITVKVKSNTLTSTSKVNDTSCSFIYQDDLEMEDVSSLPDDQ